MIRECPTCHSCPLVLVDMKHRFGRQSRRHGILRMKDADTPNDADGRCEGCVKDQRRAYFYERLTMREDRNRILAALKLTGAPREVMQVVELIVWPARDAHWRER